MTKPFEPHAYAIRVLEQLTQPLPGAYCDAKEFLWDFWPDMPWDTERSQQVARVILSDENLRFIVRAFDVRYGIAEQEYSIEVGMMVHACQNFDQQTYGTTGDQ